MIATTPASLVDAARSLVEERYGLRVGRIDHLATHSNVLYRVDLADGRRLVLRVGQPTANTRSNLEIEIAWLASLLGDPDLNLAEPIPTADGAFIADLPIDGAILPCVLFSWVPGEPMGEGAGTSGYRAMGRLSALLHRHGSWRPPAGLELRSWDRTFYYPEEIEGVVVDHFRYDHLFDGIRPTLLRTARAADRFIALRWSQDVPIVVHGDLHEWNVHVYTGRAWAIDFEDVMLALPAQDIATSLYAARTRRDLTAVVGAFRAGYEEIGEWPVCQRFDLDVYWAARQVMLMNHAAQVLPEDEARDYFDGVMPWLRHFCERAAIQRSG